MNEYEVIPNKNEIDFGATGVNEILQNVRTILTTIKGTVPFNRDFGIEISFLDNPTPVSQAKIVAEIIDAVEMYEPRCKVIEVNFYRKDDEGILIPKVKVKIDEQYL